MITEKEAREMFKLIWCIKTKTGSDLLEELTIKEWKDKGFIQKSKLDKAIEYVDSKIEQFPEFDHVTSKIKQLYEEAIKELQNDNK